MHAEIFQPDTLGVQHPEQVVVGDNQKLRRSLLKGLVQRKPRGVGMAVRADDRQVRHFGIQARAKARRPGSAREQAIGMQVQLAGQRLSPPTCLFGSLTRW